MPAAAKSKPAAASGKSAATSPGATPALPGFDFRPPAYDGPSRERALELRRRYCNPGVFTFYREPLMIVAGRGQYVFDETGRRYLDMLAGIATVACGHAHPKIVRAIQEQTARLQHATTIYLHPNLGELAEKLARKMPKGLEVTYFVNSGSEANDLAILMARLYTGAFDVIALQNGYHGGSMGAMGLTAQSSWKFAAPHGFGVHHAPCPDPYRSEYEGTPEEIAEKSAIAVEKLIQYATPGRVAAFIAEPIQGAGGVTMGAPNYLSRVYEIVRAAGGLCIADEVQTGFGRTGNHYWGFQAHGGAPDMVVTAKALGNGYPIAAVTTTREIAETLKQRVHFNTFGGNPVAAAAASAVLDVIDEEGLQENAREIGARLKAGLEKLKAKHPLVGDVRGRGLMLGVELVLNRATKEPAREATADVLEEAKNMGLLLGKGGLFGNVVRFKPPFCITAADADFAVAVLDAGLSKAKG
jgi:alanine-glyoxylate transaminase/(R)-3-amino-2-methylpropionate-pyruvate transaminase